MMLQGEKMRRSDREVTDSKRIKEIIDSSEIIRIGYYDNGEVYIVPVNFGYVEENDRYSFYFHGASAGRKFELSQNGCNVGFEMESSSKVVINDVISCRSTCLFHSVIGTGKISLVTDIKEKEKSLNIIMQHFTKKSLHTFDEKYVNIVAVFKLEVEKLSCKEKVL